MKRVVNCILEKDNKILMLQKPKKGWWVVPGGKIESTETIQEAIIREFHEETNLILTTPDLKGIFNIIIQDGKEVVDEWMMFTYFAKDFSGNLATHCDEGILRWKKIDELFSLPKAEGDNIFLKHIIYSNKFISGKFYYTPEYDLISYKIDHRLKMVKI